MRISLTDHCNLRCVYCMPVKTPRFIPSEDLLRADEIARVVRAAVRVGFRKFRLTGGEPTLRGDLLDVVRAVTAAGAHHLAMTTNGVLLPTLAQPLREAGLKRVNIHLDTLNTEHLKRVMRFAVFDQIWAGIEAAESAGLEPIKINCTVTRDYNDHDVCDLARLSMDRPWHVRFIELMPLGGGGCAQLALSQFVPTSETRERIEAEVGPLEPLPQVDPNDEARTYRFDGAQGTIGFISPVSKPFCQTCNRMRLTADGRFHLCLLNEDEMDVKVVLRNGGDDGAVEELLRRAMAAKPAGHRLEEGVSVQSREMFQIGG